jgi:hypothetical protein
MPFTRSTLSPFSVRAVKGVKDSQNTIVLVAPKNFRIRFKSRQNFDQNVLVVSQKANHKKPSCFSTGKIVMFSYTLYMQKPVCHKSALNLALTLCDGNREIQGRAQRAGGILSASTEFW